MYTFLVLSAVVLAVTNAALVLNEKASSKMEKAIFTKVNAAAQRACSDFTATKPKVQPLNALVDAINSNLTPKLNLSNFAFIATVRDDKGKQEIRDNSQRQRSFKQIGPAQVYEADCNGFGKTKITIKVLKIKQE
ncbi:uncharacterized protein LOC129596074 [Paramacrobiotus metropolitanus]|uniref:uncharacterized protein LOC129596074 n=1 Tax=Paramacrobiotus metropolitanus TaxID=2943436 RepID=UPI0024461FEE|nr:uncharacterized protein LOC129596074 [Paramacrobiotus metropolitanus]